jgi:hypothetical protein
MSKLLVKVLLLLFMVSIGLSQLYSIDDAASLYDKFKIKYNKKKLGGSAESRRQQIFFFVPTNMPDSDSLTSSQHPNHTLISFLPLY